MPIWGRTREPWLPGIDASLKIPQALKRVWVFRMFGLNCGIAYTGIHAATRGEHIIKIKLTI